MERNNPETSHLANKAASKEMRELHHQMILDALNRLKIPSIYEIIASEAGFTDKNQVSRRLLELVNDGKIYNTLQTELTSKGRKANKYALRTPETIIPIPEKFIPTETTAVDYASELIARGETVRKQKEALIQQSLFDGTND